MGADRQMRHVRLETARTTSASGTLAKSGPSTPSVSDTALVPDRHCHVPLGGFGNDLRSTMQLTHAEVINFRALGNADVRIDQKTTLIVGRNNSGKTSFVNLFEKFFGDDDTKFILED